MRIKLLFTVVLAAFLFISASGSAKPLTGPYNVQVIRVIDGDTFIGMVNVWPGVFVRVSIRVNNLDTPEKGFRAKCVSEKALGVKATKLGKHLLSKALSTQSTIFVKLLNIHKGKYAGRVIADVMVKRNGKFVSYAKLMKTANVAVDYDGGKKPSWCK